MTRKELNQYFWLNVEVADLEERLEELECKATKTTQTISAVPGAGGISDKTAIGAQMAEIRTMIEDRKTRAENKKNEILAYINGVDDCIMRMILTYRFIDRNSWNKVADRIGIGHRGDTVRKAFVRWTKQ